MFCSKHVNLRVERKKGGRTRDTVPIKTKHDKKPTDKNLQLPNSDKSKILLFQFFFEWRSMVLRTFTNILFNVAFPTNESSPQTIVKLTHMGIAGCASNPNGNCVGVVWVSTKWIITWKISLNSIKSCITQFWEFLIMVAIQSNKGGEKLLSWIRKNTGKDMEYYMTRINQDVNNIFKFDYKNV